MTKYQENYRGTMPFTDQGMKTILVANTDLPWTVPGDDLDLYRADFKFNDSANVWVAIGKAAVLPTSGVATATYNEELRPDHRYVRGGQVIHLRSTGTPEVGINLLKLPSPRT